MFSLFLRETGYVFDGGSVHSAVQLIGLTWFSEEYMLWADCVAFVELTGESRAVLLGVNIDLGEAENGLPSFIEVMYM